MPLVSSIDLAHVQLPTRLKPWAKRRVTLMLRELYSALAPFAISWMVQKSDHGLRETALPTVPGIPSLEFISPWR